MQNVVVHITIPAGTRLNNGSFLETDVTFDIVSMLTPFYAGIDQLRLMGGMYLRKVADLTLGAQIYNASKQVDLLNISPPRPAITGALMSPGISNYNLFAGARQQWVLAKATKDALLSVLALIGHPGSHVLANFSVSRMRGVDDEGVGSKLKQLDKELKDYDVTVRSGGVIAPGGHPKFGFAAKGVMDWSEKTPAREWVNTGMGANATALDFGSPTGGRGKPAKFYNQPFYSPPIIGVRQGIFQGAYPLVVTNPYPNTV